MTGPVSDDDVRECRVTAHVQVTNGDGIVLLEADIPIDESGLVQLDDKITAALGMAYSLAGSPPEPSPERPLYAAVDLKAATSYPPDWAVTIDEGWRQSILCTGMYQWAAEWLVGQLQGKPYAPEQRPGDPVR